MSPPTLARRLSRWLLLASCAVACSEGGHPVDGTPTPEPPDHLPKPELGGSESVQVTTLHTSGAPLPPTPLRGRLTQPGAEVWIVNLDRASPPLTLRAGGDGLFATTLADLFGEDRLWVVARSARQHSLPVQLTATLQGGIGLLVERPSPPPSCVTVSPRDDLTTVVASGGATTRDVLIDNDCDDPVGIDARLRLGDQGIRLSTPLTAVAPRTRGALTLTFEGHASPLERADVLLLDLVRADGLGAERIALGVYSISSASLGKP